MGLRNSMAWAKPRALPAALLGACAAASAFGEPLEVLNRLNSDPTVQGTEPSKSYRVLFDAYLEMGPPPFEISEDFNLATIHPGMAEWQAVRDWAESNLKMAEAIARCRNTNILGLPYGVEKADSKYRQAGLVAAIGADGSLRLKDFPYLDAMDVIAAFVTAETYRRMEAGEIQEALELTMIHNWILRQLCDRQFMDEKLHGITLLIYALANLLDALYTYQDSITAEQFRLLSWYYLPGLRPDRNRLHIPEGDRIVSEALLQEVFEQSQPDPERFAEVFASIQSAEAPLTRFGAARRWREIAAVHDSLEASTKRLQLIYDDWWRRWRVQEHDAILETKTQFQLTNPVRYAAVIYSMQDIQQEFEVRNLLVAAVNGTSVAAGLCAYKATFGTYPDDKEKCYGQFVRKIISDIDPYDQEYGRLRYRQLTQDDTIDTSNGRLRVKSGEGLLYSKGHNQRDDLAREHAVDAAVGDLVIWPPMRALAREQGLID